MKRIETAGIGTMFVSEFSMDADAICFFDENQELLGEADISIIFDTAEEMGISEKAAYNRLIKAIRECATSMEFEMITGISL